MEGGKLVLTPHVVPTLICSQRICMQTFPKSRNLHRATCLMQAATLEPGKRTGPCQSIVVQRTGQSIRPHDLHADLAGYDSALWHLH